MKLSNKQKEVIVKLRSIGQLKSSQINATRRTLDCLIHGGLIKEQVLFGSEGFYIQITELGKSIKL